METDLFELPFRTFTEQIAAVEHGFPSKAVARVAVVIGLPKSRLIAGLRLVPRTVAAREKSGALLSPEISEKLLRVLRARNLAREVFSTDEAAADWMSEPDRSLGGRSPLQMLTTDIGAQRVEELLGGMIHGIPQ